MGDTLKSDIIGIRNANLFHSIEYMTGPFGAMRS